MYGRITVIGIGSRVAITYVIRQIISLHKERQYKMNFQVRTSVRQSYGIIYLYYSRNDHDLSVNFMEIRYF